MKGRRSNPHVLRTVDYPRDKWLHTPDLASHQSPELPASVAAAVNEFSRPWKVMLLHEEVPLVENQEEPETETAKEDRPTVFQLYDTNTLTNASLSSPVLTFDQTLTRHSLMLDDRVGAPTSQAFVLSLLDLSLALGAIEPLFGSITLFDLRDNVRLSESFCFDLGLDKTGPGAAPEAVFYVLPTHRLEHLFFVLELSKPLMGDPDVAIWPYCSPDKYLHSPAEWTKLQQKFQHQRERMGNSGIRQPLAWGTFPLSLDSSERLRDVRLYRQKTSCSDNQRLARLAETRRGSFKEKNIPASVRFRVSMVHDVPHSKFTNLRNPFHHCIKSKEEQQPKARSRQEVQPFPSPRDRSGFGLAANGPLASSYFNVLYLYPGELERFHHRNITVRIQVQLESREVLPVVYHGPTRVTEYWTQLTYHTRQPSFGDEVKIELPIILSPEHLLIFTFYHVHCKPKKAEVGPEVEIGHAQVSLCTLLGQDPEKHLVSVQDSGIKSTNQPSQESDSSSSRSFSFQTRLVSSIYSQDRVIQELFDCISENEDPVNVTGARKVDLFDTIAQADVTELRFHLLRILRHLFQELVQSSPETLPDPKARFPEASTNPKAHPHTKALPEASQIHSCTRAYLFECLLTLIEKCFYSTGTSKALDQCKLFKAYAQVVFDFPGVASILIQEWTQVLRHDESRPSQRLSLLHAEIIFDFIGKDLATTVAPRGCMLLPTALRALFQHLVVHVMTSDTVGLIIRKEVNRQVAMFCRRLFYLGVSSDSCETLITRYYHELNPPTSVASGETVLHLIFPFLETLCGFEDLPSYRWLGQFVLSSFLPFIHPDVDVDVVIRTEACGFIRQLFELHQHQEAQMIEIFVPMLSTFVSTLVSSASELRATCQLPPTSQRNLYLCLAYLVQITPEDVLLRHMTLDSDSEMGKLQLVTLCHRFIQQFDVSTLVEVEHTSQQKNMFLLERRSTRGAHVPGSYRRRSTVSSEPVLECPPIVPEIPELNLVYFCHELDGVILTVLRATLSKTNHNPSTKLLLLISNLVYEMFQRRSFIQVHPQAYETLTSWVQVYAKLIFQPQARDMPFHSAEWCQALVQQTCDGSICALEFLFLLLEANEQALGSNTRTKLFVYATLRQVLTRNRGKPNVRLLRLLSSIVESQSTLLPSSRQCAREMMHMIQCWLVAHKEEACLEKWEMKPPGTTVKLIEEQILEIVTDILSPALVESIDAWYQDLESLLVTPEPPSCSHAQLGRIQHERIRNFLTAEVECRTPEIIRLYESAIGHYLESSVFLHEAFCLSQEFQHFLLQRQELEALHRHTLGTFATLVGLLAQEDAGGPLVPQYFKVIVASQSWIYQCRPFTSLGEMMAMITEAFAPLELEILPEGCSSPEPPPQGASSIICHIHKVECADTAGVFRYSLPCTRVASRAYGSIAEQYQKQIQLSVQPSSEAWLGRRATKSKHQIPDMPWCTRRRAVLSSVTQILCPIENSIADIRLRVTLLRAQVRSPKVEWKNLTHVLKGSVLPDVHGGIPQVVDVFLSRDTGLWDRGGHVIERRSSREQQLLGAFRIEVLAFLQACLDVLHIAQNLRAGCPDGEELTSGSVTPLQQEFEKGYLQMVHHIKAAFGDTMVTEFSQLEADIRVKLFKRLDS